MTQLSAIRALLTGLTVSLGMLVSDASGQLIAPSMWETSFNPSASATQSSWIVYAMSDGGCLSINSQSGGPLSLQRIDENGQVMWNRDTTVTQTSSVFTAVDPEGHGAILASSGAGLRIVRFNSDGIEILDRTYVSTDPNGRLSPESIGLAPNGDLVVTSWDVPPLANIVIFRLDPQGDERWRYETPGQTYQVKSTPNGATYIATRNSLVGPRLALCVDPAGNEAWRTLMPTANLWALMDVNSLGEMAVTYRESPSNDLHTIKFNSAGQVVYDHEHPSVITGNIVRGVAISEQGVVSVVTASPYQLHSFDPTGSLLWTWSYPPPFPQTAWIGYPSAYDTSGNLIVIENRPDPTVNDSLRGIDSNGQTAWTAPVGHPDGPGLNRSLQSVAINDRGHLFYQSSRSGSLGSLPDAPVLTGKVVLFSDVGVPFCDPAPANSTGSPGVLTVLGEADASADNAALYLADLPGNTFALALNSRARGFIPMLAGGQGNLCLDGAIGRYNSRIILTNAAGTGSLQLHPSGTPTPSGQVAIMAGEIWNFQTWYRDSNPSATSNLTNAVAVTF